ncbi:hypothetical protein D3C85_851790 [compost metagenome]
MAQAPGTKVDAGVEVDAAAQWLPCAPLLAVIEVGVIADEGRIDPLHPLLRPHIVTSDLTEISLGQAECPAQAGQIEGEAGPRHQGSHLDAVALELLLHRPLIGQLVDQEPPLRQLIRMKAEQRRPGILPRSHLHLLAYPLLAIDGDVELVASGGDEVGTGEAGQVDVDPQAVEQAAVKLDVSGWAACLPGHLFPHGKGAPERQGETASGVPEGGGMKAAREGHSGCHGKPPPQRQRMHRDQRKTNSPTSRAP